MTELAFAHRWIAGTSPRTLLLLHGTGGDENDLLPLAPMLDPTANVLSPRGQVLEHGAPRFFRRLAEGVFDVPDLRLRTAQLADFVAAAATHYGFDPRHVTAAGFSNGANIAASVLLLRPETLREAILFRAMVPLVPDAAPALAGRRVFLAAGRTDTMIPAANTERLATMLTGYGAEVELRWSPGGHSLGRDDVDAAAEWLAVRRAT
jgi:predicted esterase